MLIVSEAQKQRIVEYHNRHIRPKQFRVGDLVLRRANIGKGSSRIGKLSPNWEGPYRIASQIGVQAYRLETIEDGRQLPRPCNTNNLKKFYQ